VGVPHDQLLRTFSAFSQFRGCVWFAFSATFFALARRSKIDRSSRNKRNPVTQVLQSSANKKFIKKKTSKTRHHGFLEIGLHPDRVRVGVFGMRFLL
jgi:hypothetical protein